MRKSILILGAGSDQLFLIKTANEMGLVTVVVDKNPNSIGFKYAQHHSVISTRNVDEICEFATDYNLNNPKIAGVITMGSDIPEIVSSVASYLNLTCIPIESANLAKNKFLMKEKFSEIKLPTPRYKLVRDFININEMFNSLGDRLVLKPIDQAGSRGVSLVTKKDDWKSLFLHAQDSSAFKEILVEEFIPGQQISTESIILEDSILTPGYADRNYDDLELFRPQIMENGGWVPSAYPLLKVKIDELISKAAKVLNLRNCVVKGDIVLDKNSNPMIIEIAARLSGGDFSESLVPIGTGINYVKAAIKLAIGEKPNIDELKPKFEKVVANRYFFANHGKLIDIEGVNMVRRYDWMHKFEIWYKKGDFLPKISNHGQRTGVFIISGKSREQVQERINFVYNTVRFHTSNG